jgi:hypothetical protein
MIIFKLTSFDIEAFDVVDGSLIHRRNTAKNMQLSSCADNGGKLLSKTEDGKFRQVSTSDPLQTACAVSLIQFLCGNQAV